MWRESWKLKLIFIYCFLYAISATGQNTDCVTAQIICSDGPVNFNPTGIGIDDFANPNNSFGCFELAIEAGDSTAENGSGWYYFEFRQDMPPNSIIEFTITPFGGFGEDYDFMVFGPDLSCDSLGEPVRCSFAYLLCDFCPQTGLGRGETDTGEGAFGNGFVAPMVVQPGEGYYLMLDNFVRTTRGFTLEWGGSAAPYLNCQADPFCKNAAISAGEDIDVCAGSAPFELRASSTGVSSRAVYNWIGTPEALSFLDDVNKLQPTITIPADFEGELQYILTLSDGECVLADDVYITVLGNTSSAITGDNILCIGESTTLDAGAGYQNYLWSNGATSRAISINTPGSYSVTTTNSNNCTNTSTIEVLRSDPPQPTLQGGTIICLDDPLTLDAGPGYRSYRWSNGATTQTIDILQAGAYRVTVTNADGCEGTAEVTTTESVKPETEILGDTVFCFNQNTTLRTSATFSSYLWSNGATTPTIDVSDSGTYIVTVTAADGCAAEASITVQEKEALNVSISGDLDICEGENTQLSATPGFSSYLWSTSQTAPNINVDTGNTYSLTVTDNAGCQGIATADVIENPTPIPVIRGATGICPGETTRLETDAVFAKYTWSNGVNSPFIEVDQAATYTLEVESTAGCIGTASITLSMFPAVEPEVRGDITFCPDIGGVLETTQSYVSYLWSNQDSSATTRVFSDGTFTVSVTDANGCSGSGAITVDAYEVDAPPVSADTSICAGNSLTLDAGVDFPEYLWSNGATSRSITITNGAVYTLTVTDINGCTASATYNVTENPAPTAQIQGANSLCIGDTSELSVTGNFREILWSNGAQTPTINISDAGIYSVTATDDNGCSNQTSVQVQGFEKPVPVIVGPAAICDGEEITLQVNQNFQAYRWSNGQDQASIRVQQGGLFEVEVTDANGCIGKASTQITENMAPQIDIEGDTFFCQGLTTQLQVTPGYAFYRWSNGANSASIEISNPGNYTVTVEDALGCTSDKSLEIIQIELPTANAGTSQTLDCNTTSVELGDSGNEGNYSYRWEGPGINETNHHQANPEVSVAGNYTLVTIDQTYGCASIPSGVLVSDESYEPQVVLRTQGTLDCQTNSIVLDAIGSPTGANFNYNWYNPQRQLISNGNTQQLNVSEPGEYYLEIEDTQTGCVGTNSITVQGNFDFPIAEAGEPQLLTCKNTKVYLNGSASSPGSKYAYQWTSINGNIVKDDTTLSPTVDQMGIYLLTVLNKSNGCSSTDSVEVLEDRTPPAVEAGEDQLLDCNIPEVFLNGTASSGGANLYYTWSSDNGYRFSDPHTATVQVNKPGFYSLEVINLDNGCSAVDFVTVIDDSDYPTGIEMKLLDPLCLGDQNGQVQIEGVYGGTAPYFFSLNGAPFEAVNNFDSLAAGNYKIKVEDVAGCSFETTFSLDEGMTLRVDLGPDIFSKPGQEITLEPVVNIPRRDITNLLWEGGELKDSCLCWQQTVAPGETTLYQITATNTLGCTATDKLLVNIDSLGRVYIPTAFSPNKDGYNDVFMIYSGDELVKVKYLRIFDRWGNQVYYAEDFYTNNPTYGWDGNSNGKEQNADIYVFVAEIEFYDVKVRKFKGEINLIR